VSLVCAQVRLRQSEIDEVVCTWTAASRLSSINRTKATICCAWNRSPLLVLSQEKRAPRFARDRARARGSRIRIVRWALRVPRPYRLRQNRAGARAREFPSSARHALSASTCPIRGEHSVSKLIALPPGYVGHKMAASSRKGNQRGILTPSRAADEIEKRTRTSSNILLRCSRTAI